jgi:hypothetical protein
MDLTILDGVADSALVGVGLGAEALGRSKRSVHRYAQTGLLRDYRVGDKRLLRVGDLRAFAAGKPLPNDRDATVGLAIEHARLQGHRPSPAWEGPLHALFGEDGVAGDPEALERLVILGATLFAKAANLPPQGQGVRFAPVIAACCVPDLQKVCGMLGVHDD